MRRSNNDPATLFDRRLQPDIDYRIYSPGFLKPEQLIAEIETTLQEALLNGKPFGSILLDGLHNVFLEFPDLEASNLLWTALYSLLAPYNLTVVTTFTTFSLHLSQNIAEMEQDILMRRQLPLLHALVQAADFYLELEPPDLKVPNPLLVGRRTYRLTVRQAIDQAFPNEELIWDRETYTLNPMQAELKLSPPDSKPPDGRRRRHKPTPS